MPANRYGSSARSARRSEPRSAGRGGATPRRQRGASSRAAALLTASLVVLALAAAAAAYTYQIASDGRIYLGVSSQGIDLGGYTPQEARSVLADSFERFSRTPVVLRYQAREWRALPEELGVQLKMQDAVDAAYAVGRQGSLVQRLGVQLIAFLRGYSVGQSVVAVDEGRRAAYLGNVAREIAQPPVDAQLHLRPGQQVVVLSGRPGRRLNVERTAQRIDEEIARRGLRVRGSPAELTSTPTSQLAGDGQGASADSPSAPGLDVELVVEEVPPTVSERDLAATAELARKMMSAPLTLRLGDRTWTLTQDQIQGLLSIKEVGRETGATGRGFDVVVDQAALEKLLRDTTREGEQAPRNARFDYSGGQLRAISPGAEGRRVDVAAAASAVKAALAGSDRSVQLPLTVVKPTIGPGDGAKLGRLELIEQASTDYDVGTAERRFNVELAASRVHGVVVPPGATFSFNDEVGEVSSRSGYKQGYGIAQDSSGELLTIPSEGGGICQVATTLFHSVFWAGYPIVERHWHSYWIPRYGQPPKGLKGLDATVDQIYDNKGNLVAAVDFRFKNNTESYILIQARYDRKNLTFQLYGTPPGWEVRASAPKIEKEVEADTTPVYQVDPKMARGAQMMIEEARDGFQATIVRTVSQDGKVLEQRSFVSTYRPSRNVYVVGERPTPTPTARPSPKPSGTPGATTTPAASPPAQRTQTPQPTSAPGKPTSAPGPTATPAPTASTPRPTATTAKPTATAPRPTATAAPATPTPRR